MSYTHTKSEVTKWNIDEETVDILKQLKDSPIFIPANGMPTLQPAIISSKTGKMPIAWLTLRFGYEVQGAESRVILDYVFEDTYQISVQTLTTGHVREMVALSYDRWGAKFDELNEKIMLDAGIEEPSETEFEQLCHSVSQFLKEKLSKPGHKS